MKNTLVKSIKLIVMVAFLVIIFTAISACSRGSAGEGKVAPESDFQVQLTDDRAGVMIVKYNGSASKVNIPSTIQGMPVKEIAGFSKNTAIKSVIIPEGVTLIYGSTFEECSNLSSVSLPSTLRSIGSSTFADCKALKSIDLPAGLVAIGAEAFYRSGLTSFPNPWPEGITTIAGSMFMGTSISGSLIIPEGITNIGGHAFSRTQIASLTLPSTIKQIGQLAFNNCSSLTTVNIPESVRRISIDSTARTAFPLSQLTLQSQARLMEVDRSGF